MLAKQNVTKAGPPVSIGMPVFNAEKYLAEALKSNLNQSFQDFDLIISDNASTDGTEDICRHYAARDKRIRYFRNAENIGANRNFNRVFQLSTGEYFKWASADDICHPNLVVRCLEALETHRSAVLAYPETNFIDDSGSILDLKDPGWNLLSESAHDRLRYVIHSGHWVNAFYGLIRTASLTKTRLFPFYAGGDYRLLGELSLLGKFMEIPECLFFRRIHPGASSHNSSQEWQSSFFFAQSRKLSLPFWHLYLDHVLTAIRSGLSTTEKFSLFGTIFYCMLLGRSRLVKDLQTALKYLIERSLFHR